jgi:hypothetical protein
MGLILGKDQLCLKIILRKLENSYSITIQPPLGELCIITNFSHILISCVKLLELIQCLNNNVIIYGIHMILIDQDIFQKKR